MAVVEDDSGQMHLQGSMNGRPCGLNPKLQEHDIGGLKWLLKKHIFPRNPPPQEAYRKVVARLERFAEHIKNES